jgi:anti-anti-sigma factor
MEDNDCFPMPIHLEKKGEVDIVSLEGRLDFSGTEDLMADVKHLLAAGGKHMIFDCRELLYVSSTGLRIFIFALKELQPKGGRVLICGLNQHIRSVFSMAGLLQLFEIHTTREEALAAL